MRAFIYAFQGKPWNEDCAAAYNGFKKLGVESILFSCNEELDQRNPEDIVVGGMLIMGSVFEQLGIAPDNYDYPEELTDYLGRKNNTILLKDLQKQELPVFIKPVKEKAAKGTVVKTLDDAEEYYRVLDSETEIFCSEVVDFVSEWRCLVRYGKILGVQIYNGDRMYAYDRKVIEKAVRDYSNSPAACSLDFGVTKDGKTILIEVNDGFAIGAYGLQDAQYAMFLETRWAELTRTADPWKNQTQIVSVLEPFELKGTGTFCIFHVPLGTAEEVFKAGDVWANQKEIEYTVESVSVTTNCWYNPHDQVCVIMRTSKGVSPEKDDVLYKK